ncbi:DEAD/DEAH box helicase [Heyndrickxia acidicola]|uniref:DEAD/DEAH box helicase n=1 Tax=Heyndrickxia acidicola TaxID=209389 RepID=A0ABU6ME64_9BACI|nr:DEAD/DEAH box helicase [Heyndrickxia acidicola]MED1202946.1 DEAD/DEAH box helicase [Heyndrickxia acidicola]
MLNSNTLTVHIDNQSYGNFFLYVTDENGKDIDPDEWKRALFIWHDESFFGTLISKAAFQSHLGLELNSWMLVTLLGKESFNSLLRLEWDEKGELFFSASSIIFEAISQKLYSPAFMDDEDDFIKWNLPAMVEDEFSSSFWEHKVDGDTAKNLIEEWFHHAVSSLLQQNRRIQQKIDALKRSHLTSSELTSYFDEQRFQKWVEEANDRPFSIGLRLLEPEDENDLWQLETIIKDKKDKDKIISITKEDKIPKKWLPYMDEIQHEQEGWLTLFPWLEEKGALKQELDEGLAWEFLTNASEKLTFLGVDILLPSWWASLREAQLTLKAKMKQNNTNYRPSFVGLNTVLDFNWRLSMQGAELSEEEFQQLVEQRRHLAKVNGQWIKLDPKMIRQLQELMQRAKQEGLTMRDLLEQELIPSETDEVDEFSPRAFANIQIEMNRSLKKFIHQLKDLNSIPNVAIPKPFKGQLRPYQQQGLNWLGFLRSVGIGAVLADDMGLGKTIQLIAYLLHVKQNTGSNAPALIICPTSVLGNWQKEIDRFAPELNVKLHYGPNRLKADYFKEEAEGTDIVLTSYGLAQLDQEELLSLNWSTIALDEAQNIKNAQTKQSRAIRKLNGGHKIALTGTPMENRLSELWTIFDFTNHGFLGTFTQFQKRFIVPIEKDEDQSKIQELQGLIRPFLLRRTKKDPEVELNLPDKLEQKEYCPLTAEQASLYEQLMRDTFNELEQLTGFQRKGLILQMLNRLKQLCNHPSLYLKEEKPVSIRERSYKLEKLMELIESVLDSKEACLIFTQYIGMGEMIQHILQEEYGITVPFLNGSMPKAKRDEYVQCFQEGEFPVFLLSLKAGGTGLNLTAANHVIHYDRWWNPAVENQATDRAYRIGQKRFVHVHKLITTGTLEEKIDAMLEKKQSLNDEIIQSDDWITELSNVELQNLLSLTM